MSTPSVVCRRARPAAALLLSLALLGCANSPDPVALISGDTLFGFIKPYRMDIVQGNVVTQEQAERVKPGMSRVQVRDALGSPMLADIFHADRWDYIFTIRRQGTLPQRRDVVVHFKDDKLERIEAADLPSEKEFVASISRPLSERDPPVLELTPAQIKALPKPVKTAAEQPVVPVGAIRNYPPLEPS